VGGYGQREHGHRHHEEPCHALVHLPLRVVDAATAAPWSAVAVSARGSPVALTLGVGSSGPCRAMVSRGGQRPRISGGAHFGSRIVWTIVLSPGNCSSCQATTKSPLGA